MEVIRGGDFANYWEGGGGGAVRLATYLSSLNVFVTQLYSVIIQK